MRVALKWTNRVVTTILLIALLLMVFAVIASRASGGQPSMFGYRMKVVLSGSMEPVFQTGSIIAIKPTENGASFHRGDVITFKTSKNMMVTHRIYEVKNGGHQYITKGDNNDGPDPWTVLSQNVVGEYTGFTIPYVGYVLHFSKTQLGTALLLILPGILLLIYAGINIWRGISDLEKRQQETPSEKSV